MFQLKSMARVALTSAGKNIHSHDSAYENTNTHVGDASFSSYLNNTRVTTILQLTESSWDLSPTITTPQRPLCPISIGKQKNQDIEISVFGAEKYFNGGMDEEMPRISEKVARKKGEQVDLHCIKPKIKPGTPSGNSVTSWNNQSTFLPRLLRNTSLSKQNYGKRFLASLGCNCYCSDKKSVDIDENVEENNHKKNVGCGVLSKEITNGPIKIGRDPLGFVKKSQLEPWVKDEMHCQKFGKVGTGLNREECFTFPILNSGLGNITVKRQFEEKDEEGQARKSLEVFGSSTSSEKGNMGLNLERRLAMLNWDATLRVGIPATSGDDDNESDASSDLFEIASLSSNARPSLTLSSNARPSLTRQPSHGMSSCVTSATCYEPSEASIECAANISAPAPAPAPAPAYNESRPAAIVTKPEGIVLTTTTTAKTAMGKEFQIRRSILPLGCKSRNAVKVVGDAYTMKEKPKSDLQMHQRPDSFKMGRFQAESKVMDFEMAHARRAFASHTLLRSNSARQS